MFPVKFQRMNVSDLPLVNASLNALSTVFISAGWYLVRRGRWRQHVVCMVIALITSTLFLASYLTYHYARGGQATQFSGTGWIRPVYFTILITHILLAFAIVPMVVATLVPAIRRRWTKHARVGRWTMPVWLYVSVTGVIVYLMLYQWYPPIGR